MPSIPAIGTEAGKSLSFRAWFTVRAIHWEYILETSRQTDKIKNSFTAIVPTQRHFFGHLLSYLELALYYIILHLLINPPSSWRSQDPSFTLVGVLKGDSYVGSIKKFVCTFLPFSALLRHHWPLKQLQTCKQSLECFKIKGRGRWLKECKLFFSSSSSCNKKLNLCVCSLPHPSATF